MPRTVPRPSILKDHSHLIDAFKKGTYALRKRVLESAYTASGVRKVFTKDAFGLVHTQSEIYGTVGWNFPSLEIKDIVSYFPAFEEFSTGEYTKWTDDDTSPETFKQMETAAINALKKDASLMYAQLKPELIKSMRLIKTALFGPDNTEPAGTKRKSETEKDIVFHFTDNNETAIADIRALYDICSHAEKYLMMLITDDSE
jgi:hypothetical protein